jgi:hypothetical protein
LTKVKENKMTVTVVAEQGSHLLITDGERYAVLERRDDHLYNCHDRARAGIPARDISGADQILDDSDWNDRETAQATFNAVVTRGSDLAQRM